jgi:hypothetical protein
MKPLLFSLLLGATAIVASAADNASVAGKWQIHNNIAGNESDMACDWTQKDSDLAGTCSSDHGNINITGKIDGKNVSWTYKSEYNGGPITLTYKGTLGSANSISGTVAVEEYSVEGDFTATQAK